MNPLRQNAMPFARGLFVLVPFSIALVFLIIGVSNSAIAHAGATSAVSQDTEKSLDIERYPNEPLELVDLKVSERSIKNMIGVRSRTDSDGLDSVKFSDTDEWFRRVSVRLRNISGKPIIGLRAYLYFKPPGSTVLFRVALVPSRNLQLQNMDAAAEIDLTVTNQQWNQTADILKQHSADPKLAAVTFSVELVSFSDGLQWYRGRLLRPDPENPSKWIPVDKPDR
jgi:hypothetical protein